MGRTPPHRLAAWNGKRRLSRLPDWGQRGARVICAFLALVGVLPFVAAGVVRSAWAREWTARETQRLLRQAGIVATYAPRLRVWPVAAELDDLRLNSTDGPPLLECARILVRPKLLALLGGTFAVDQVDLEEPRIHAVFRNGRLANLSLPKGGEGHEEAPARAPFSALSVTEASIDLDYDGARFTAQSIDLDVDEAETSTPGLAFETAVRVGKAAIHRRRDDPSSHATAVDDDAICSLKARVRIDPEAVVIRRLDAVAVADLDPAPDTTPDCDTDAADVRRVELSLGHARIGRNMSAGLPEIDGHVGVRSPLALAGRFVTMPPVEGWARLDADVRSGSGNALPDVSGTLEAHAVKLAQYAFAHTLHSEFQLTRNVLESPLTTVEIAGGTVKISDVVLHPLDHGRIERARIDGGAVDFTTLLRDLGVHPSSWVAWDIRELHVPRLTGTLLPLKLDGEMSSHTSAFGVYDRPAKDKDRQRLVGFSEAQLACRVGIRSDALEFLDLRANLPHSQVSGGFVSIGFRNDLRIEVPDMKADLEDLSPLGGVPIHGVLVAKAHVGGVFNHPTPEGDIQSATDLTIADVAFGDVSAGHIRVDTPKSEVSITGVRAKKRASEYEVPTAELRFGGATGFVVDAMARSEALGLRDLLAMFALDDDPRFDDIDAALGMQADVHVAVGSPEDSCGGGFVSVGARGRLAKVDLYGERFGQGSADISFRWFDRQHGLAGAEADVRSFVLQKESATGASTASAGSVLGAGTLRRGGAIAGNLVLQGLSLSRTTLLGTAARQIEGTVSGVAHVTGNLDDFQPDAGILTHAQLEVSPVRVRGVPFPGSRLDVRLTHKLTQERARLGNTRCGAPIAAPFDKQAYATDTTSHGDWQVDGDLLGGAIHLSHVDVTRARSPHVTGRASLRALDLSAIALALGQKEGDSEEARAAPSKLGGQLSGDLDIDDLPVLTPAAARLRFQFGPTVLSRDGQRLTLKPPSDPLVVADDVLTLPTLEAVIDTPEGFRGGFVISGGARDIAGDPLLSIDAKLEPLDLALLKHVLPKVEDANGRVEGALHVGGRALSPEVSGELHAVADTLEVHGLPSAVTDLRVDARAQSSEISVSASGRFAGGTLRFDATMPLRGLDLGSLEGRLAARDVRVAPADGISAAFDADLNVGYDPKIRGTETTLPRVTGDVTLTSLRYTRPITFNVDIASTRAKRTEVDAYDPARDFVSMDVRVRSQTPIVIKNNLIEVQLGIDSGALEVTGTNQRMGLRGVLKALPGGRFHFQANEFEVQQGFIRFDDATRIAPNVDITAVTEYRRYTDTSAASAAGAGAGTGPAAASTGSTRDGSLWRITLHAYGDADNVRVDMTSEPALSQEDIVLLLMVGMTRAELDQLQAGGIGESVALNVLGAASGADRAVKQALPIIDDFRFGSAYSTETGKTEPQLTVGKRLTNDLRASVTAGLSEDRELRADIEWRLNNRLSLQGSYDNINDVSSSALGNLGVDLRWRLEFE